MPDFQRRLQPPVISRPWRRDLAAIAVLALLSWCLLPTLAIDFGAVALGAASADPQGRSPEQAEAAGEYRNAQADLLIQDFSGQLASAYLLPALGVLLCLRRGLVDLSVWAVMGLGGVVCAALIGYGVPPATAMALATGTGLAVGTVHVGLIQYLRVPSAAATLITAGLIVLTFRLASDPAAPLGGDLPGQGDYRPPPALTVPEKTFDGWRLTQRVVYIEQGEPGPDGATAPRPVTAEEARPLDVTRMVLVVAGYSAVVLTMMIAGWIDPEDRRSERGSSAVVLVASAGLSALAGSLWLLDSGRAPLPYRLVGELRIPAAAILAGATFLAGGRNRHLLCAVFLPLSLLLATLWERHVWDLPAHGYLLQTLVLAVLAAGVYAAMGEWLKTRRRGRLSAGLAAGAALGGLLMVALAGRSFEPAWRQTFHLLGAGTWTAGMAAFAFVRWRRAGRQARARLGLAGPSAEAEA